MISTCFYIAIKHIIGNYAIQNILYRYKYANDTLTYIAIVQDVVDSYNATKHSLLGRSPKNVIDKHLEC